jgi:hypothetical protein
MTRFKSEWLETVVLCLKLHRYLPAKAFPISFPIGESYKSEIYTQRDSVNELVIQINQLHQTDWILELISFLGANFVFYNLK